MNVFKKALVLSLVTTSLTSYAGLNSKTRLFDMGVDEVLGSIEASIETVKNPTDCKESLSQTYQVLYNFDSKEANLPGMTDEDLKRLTQKSFNLRLALKEELKQLNYNHPDGKACLLGAKEITKALRYVEDYFIEYLYKRNGRDQEEFITLAGDGVHFLKKDGLDFKDSNDLKEGDVLLSRGNAFTSAAIARIGQDDYQFSHMTLVNHNEEGKLYTSEAHIEWGSVVEPFQVHLDQKNARTVLFRHQDEKLAKRASEYTYHFIKNHKQTRGYNIEYDFGMDLSDEKRIFCSEVPYTGYLHAAKELYNEEMKLPMYPTQFEKAHLKFLQTIGINVNTENIGTFSTFGPGDMQFDPRFEMLAEWRNPTKLKDTRFKDAILTKIFEWMGEKDYSFHNSFGTKIQNTFAWILRRNRYLSRKLELDQRFPLNMKVKQMNVFTVLDVVGEALQAELEIHQAKSETPLTFKELYTILEDFRIRDLAAYKKKSAKFHKRFRP